MLSRRAFLGSAAMGAGLPPAAAVPLPPRVAIARCTDYGAALRPALARLFDQIGGLGRLVRGKTVAIKINMTGWPRVRMGYVASEDAQYTHPAVIGVAVALMGEAGARRVTILEGAFACAEPLGEFMLDTGWDPALLLAAAPRVELINSNVLGGARRYARFWTPGRKGYIFPGFDLHPAHAECDVLVSIAKLKEHGTAGVTLSIKNMFGSTPISIYGDAAGKDEPNEGPHGGRGAIMHKGVRGPALSAPQEADPQSPRDDKYRIPRIITDIVAARPVDLAILDGIHSMAGGEGPWIKGVRPIRPGLLVAGTNCVATDAVGTALMGFNPLAERGTAPFERCDSTLKLAEDAGLGTRDPARIEIAGVPLREAVFPFRRRG